MLRRLLSPGGIMSGGSVNSEEPYTVFKDQELTCNVCIAPFVFTSGEQVFWAIKGFKNAPKRCANCRLMAKLRRDGNEKQPFSISCARCNIKAIVPFKPSGCKPVYCHNCHCLVRHKQQQLEVACLNKIETLYSQLTVVPDARSGS